MIREYVRITENKRNNIFNWFLIIRLESEKWLFQKKNFDKNVTVAILCFECRDWENAFGRIFWYFFERLKMSSQLSKISNKRNLYLEKQIQRIFSIPNKTLIFSYKYSKNKEKINYFHHPKKYLQTVFSGDTHRLFLFWRNNQQAIWEG